jgi:hypothetical protein
MQKEGEPTPLGIYSIFTPFLSSFLIEIASQSNSVTNASRSLSPTLTDPSSKQPTSIQKDGELTPLGIYAIFTPFLSSFLIEDLSIEDQLVQMSEYQAKVADLIIRKGNHRGKFRCNHCHLIRKSLGREEKDSEWVLDCGCSKEKGVVEAILVERIIIGKGVEDKGLQSLTEGEWARMDHIMAALFGYNSTWLLKPELMKAGFLAAIARLENGGN